MEKIWPSPAISLIEQAHFLADKGLVLVEEHREVQLPATTQQMQLLDHRKYGETGIWIYGAIASTTDYAHKESFRS